MNFEELKAGGDMFQLGQQQGWSQSTWLHLLHAFVTEKGLNVELLTYLKTRAAEGV